ncbi:MAG: RraA family protein [Arthrobacter sp.]|nr:RraA family protein [Arthrobacter sp.]
MMTIELIPRLAVLDTPAVSDALDKLGIAGQCAGIMPLDRSFNLTGTAYCIKYVPANELGGTVGDFVDDLGPDHVAVIDNAGRLDATVWGDLMTTVAKKNGVAGTVIDGVCRDLDRALEFDYPLFSRGNWMRTGKDRVQLEAIGVPVIIGGITVRPGDLLRGDINGVVVIPAARSQEVVEAAERIQQTEDSIRAEIQNGADLREARQRAGYHRLQTPVS